MLSALLVCLLAAPGTIHVRVEGAAREVVAYRQGEECARAAVADGRAVLDGLEPLAYDLRAEGEGCASEVVADVRAVDGDAEGFDAVLVARRAHPVQVKTEPGARVWTSGLSFAPRALLLPEGMHRIVVDHPSFVSSAERWVRVAGPLEVDVPLEQGLAVTGRITGPEGEAAAGAQVEVFVDGLPARRSAFADAGGEFAVTGFRGDVVSLRVTAPGLATRLHRVLFDPLGERARVEIALAPGSAAGVEVPFAGADAVLLPAWYEIVLEEPRLRANHTLVRASGTHCVFTGLVPGRSYRILAHAPGRTPARTECFAAPAAGETLVLPKLALDRGAALTGRITGVDGAGATVVSQGPEGTLTCRADRRGRFEFRGLDPGEHVLWVRDIDETGVPVTLAKGEARDIALACAAAPAGNGIHGSVFDADGAPLAGVIVEAAGQRAVTDEKGSFRIDGLRRGPGRVAVGFTPGPGCRALAEDPHLPYAERKATLGAEIRVQLARAGRLWVRLEPGERQLVRATLHLASAATGLRLARRLPRHAGEILLEDLPVGGYVVDVAAPGTYGTGGAVVQVEPAPEAATPVAVRPGRTIRGRVAVRRWLDRPGAAPVDVDAPAERGFVALLDADPLRAPALAPIEPDGRFLLDGLPDGMLTLCAAVPGYPVATELVAADEVEIAVEEAAEAAVRVTGDRGQALPDARVQILTAQGLDVRDIFAVGRLRGVVADDAECDELVLSFDLNRDADGRITASFLAPGSYSFHIAAEGHEPAKVGVRARTVAARERIRRSAVDDLARDFPSGPPDLASPVQLSRAKD